MGYTLFETKLGPCAIAWSDTGITAFQLPEETDELTVERIAKRTQTADAKPPAWVKKAIKAVQKHLEGKPQSFADVPLDLRDSPEFHGAVYQALLKVPPGRTTSYGELAKAAGSPGAARAVGRAMATNPIPVLVACHRVLGADGKPTGFSAYGGLVTKEKILALEGWKNPALGSLFATTASSLPFDSRKALKHLSDADAVLAKHIAQVPFAFEMRGTEGVFAALAEAIVYQQLHGKAAATIFGRVKALFPKGKLDPKKLTLMDEADLRKAGLSANKYKALRDLAERADRGEIPTLAQLEKMDDEAIVDALTKVRGIGRWTVEMLLMFRLGRPDVFPIADFGIRKGFARLYHPKKKRDEMPDVDQMLKQAEKWRPFRSIASWYLWRATELED
jgi:methylated-DNA-[protein]-cysteine S-methyltransferase